MVNPFFSKLVKRFTEFREQQILRLQKVAELLFPDFDTIRLARAWLHIPLCRGSFRPVRNGSSGLGETAD